MVGVITVPVAVVRVCLIKSSEKFARHGLAISMIRVPVWLSKTVCLEMVMLCEGTNCYYGHD